VTQRTRDLITEPLTLDYFQRKAKDGWALVAVEWAREAETAIPAALSPASETEEIPYGYHIADDCTHLVQNPLEIEVVLVILEKVVSEWRAPQIAEELNLRGYRTRVGTSWTASAVFDLLPRLIEMGPKLLKRSDWPERRQKLVFAK
jgi:hypothetical protein